MRQEEKKALKKSIENEIAALEKEIKKIESTLRPIKKDCSLDNVAHQGLKQEQNINIQRYEETKKRLNRLKHAHLKVDTEEYGICQECEEEIALERLKLVPESIYCVSCMNELGL